MAEVDNNRGEQSLVILLRAKHEDRAEDAVRYMATLDEHEMRMALIATLNLAHELLVLHGAPDAWIDHWAAIT